MEATSTPAISNETAIVEQLTVIAEQSKGWLKFIGIVNIVIGGFSALSIVGILFAWLPIWIGILLFQAGNQVDILKSTKDSTKLVAMMDKLKTYFIIQGVLSIIGIAAIIIAMIVAGGAIFSFFHLLNR